MQIGILGATGPAGRGLAARLASVGYDVVLGSRSRYRAREVAEKLIDRWPDWKLPIAAGDNAAAAAAEVVVVATPWDAAAETVSGLAADLAGKVVISMCNALAKVGDEFQPLVPPRGSVAASVQAALPRSMVSAALHHVPARELGLLDVTIDSDVLICSDHPAATEATVDIVNKLPGVRPLDAGHLSNAAPIEAFAAVLLQLNVRYRTRVAVQFSGLPELRPAPLPRPPGADTST